MADKWWRRGLRPKHPYVIAGLAVGILVGIVVLVALLCGGKQTAVAGTVTVGGAQVPVSGTVTVGRAQPRSPKIVGGNPVDVAEVPSITSIGTSKKHLCHGSLVTSQFVYTTAHCIKKYNTKLLTLVMGRSNLDDEGGVTRRVKDYRVHPQWDPNKPKIWAYDQAMVKLDRPVENIKPACFAAEGSVFPTGTKATVYGWGRNGTSDLPAPRTLQGVNVTVTDHGQCKRKYYGKVTDDMICAGNEAGGHDICAGDSGAPLVVKVGDDLIQVGSNIRGPSKCGAANSPAVYEEYQKAFMQEAIKQMSDPPQVTQCGMRNNVPDVRVENGQVSAPHSLPWMAYVESAKGHFSGGATLIHESLVVTEWASPGYYVVLGAHSRSSTSEPIQRIMIEQVFMHPNFTYRAVWLVKLSRPVKFTKNIGPICLPKPGDALPAGSDCLVSGWGDNKKPDYSGLTDVLREGSVTTITTDQCRRDWDDIYGDDPDDTYFLMIRDKVITNATICIASDEKSYPSHRDRGGPLMCEEKDSLIYNLQGVHYWTVPFMYHNVSAMVPWINEMISQFPADASSKVCFKKFEG